MEPKKKKQTNKNENKKRHSKNLHKKNPKKPPFNRCLHSFIRRAATDGLKKLNNKLRLDL